MKNAARPFYKSKDRAHEKRPAFVVRPIAYFVMLACCDAALANPNGPQVINGSVQMQGLGTGNLQITNSPGSIINWQGFSIGAGQLTNFIQQSGASAVLNRVVGPNISQIQGTLQSNGRVFLINPAGIVIGAGAVIDTAGFVGSTLHMLDADFLKGKLSFQGDANAGSIINQGYIKTTSGGSVVLVAPNIENSGLIQTDDGKILLAAGKKLTIGSLDANDVQFEVQAPTDSVLNIGQLLANGGAVGVFAGTLKHTGDIRANALTRDEAGRIVLKSQGDIFLAGNSTTSATGVKGGSVQVLGDRVGIFDNAKIDVSGEKGGGTILLGGDYRGANPLVQNATATYVGPDTVIRADATQSGDGGKLIVWSNESTRVYGALSTVGAGGGNGGFVETSGKFFLDVGGLGPDVGSGGTWLLDPFNITVTAATNSNNTNSPNFTPTGNNSQVSAAAINARLNADASVTLNTAGGGSDVGNITVNAPITKSAGAGSPTLTLQANASIDINSPISNTSGVLSVALNAGDSINVNAPITRGGTTGGSFTLNAGNAITVGAKITAASAINMTAGTAPGSTADITLNNQVVTNTGSSGGTGITLTNNARNIILNTGNLFALQSLGDGAASPTPVTLNAPNGALVNNSTGSVVIQDASLLTVQTAQGMTGSAITTLQTNNVGAVAVSAGNGNFAINNAATGLTVNASTAGAGRSLSFAVAAGQGISTGGNITVGTGGTVSLTGDTIAVSNLINAPGGTINFATANKLPIEFSNNAETLGIRMVLDSTELGRLTASRLRVGDANATAVSFLQAVAPAGITGSLTVRAAGPITQSGAGSISVPALEASGTTVTLTNAALNVPGAIAGQATAGDFSLTAPTIQVGSVLDFTGITASSDVALTATGVAAGTGTITSIGAAAVGGVNVQLDSQRGIGTSTTSRMNTAATNLSARSQTSGGVFISEADAVTLGIGRAGFANVAAGGAAYDATAAGTVTSGAGGVNLLGTGTTTLTSTNGGNVVVTTNIGNAGTATVVQSAGTITGTGTVIGNNVTLDSATGIGVDATTRLNTTATTLAARSTTGGGVFVTETDAVTLNNIGTVGNGAASGTYDLTAGGGITVTGVVGSSASATTLTAAVGGSTIAGTGTVRGTTVTLSAQNGIGTSAASRLNTDAGTLFATTTSTSVAAPVFLSELNGVSLNTSGAAIGGTFDLTAAGAIALIGNVTTSGTVALTTTGGSANTITQTAGALTAGTLAVTTTNADASFTSATNAVGTLGNIALGTGIFTLRNNAAISQGLGTTITAGGGSFNAGANAITLNNTGNDFSGAVSLTGNAITIRDTNALTLGATNTGGAALIVNAGGAILQTGAISAGAATFNAGANNVTLTNTANDFTGAVTLNVSGTSDVSISDVNALTLAVPTSLGRNLTLTAGAAGGAGALTLPAATLTTTGAQTYSSTSGTTLNGNLSGTSISITGATTLPAASTRSLTATAGGITFGGAVSGNSALTLSSTAGTTFNGVVGGGGAGGALTSLSVTGGATAMNGGAITTSGLQSYAGPVTIGADTTATSTGGSPITFSNTVDGPSALTVATSGATTFTGAVGATAALASLTTNATGTTSINGGSVTTTGAQSYGDPVTLGQNTTLTGGTPTFATVSGAGFNLALNFSGQTDIGPNFINVRDLSSGGGGTTTLTGGISTTGRQTYSDAVLLQGATTLTSTGTNAAGDITFASTVSNATAQALTVNTPNGGTTTFAGTVTGLASITTDAGGSTSLAASITTTGAQTYGDTINLTGATTLASSGGANITFNGAVNGPSSLTVNTAGTTRFGNTVGVGTPLASMTTDGPGTTVLAGGTLVTTGAQSYSDPVTLDANATLTSTGTGGITFAGTVNSNPLGAARSLTVTTGGTTTFGGAVGTGAAGNALAFVTTTGSAGTAINGGAMTTTGAQSYGPAVTLGADTTLQSTAAGDVTFVTTVNSNGPGTPRALTVDTGGATRFNGAVGGTNPLLSLTTTGGGSTFLGGSVTTTTTQTYEPLELTGNATLTGTTGTFNGITGHEFDLGLNFSGATTITPALFTGVHNLSSGGGGTTSLSGAVSTSGTQTYDDAVTLAGATTVTSTGNGAIAFNSTLNGGFALTVTTDGTKTFAGAVGTGAGGALTSLQTTGTGTTAINGGAVTTSGLQSYGAAVTLDNLDAALTSSNNANITFGGTVNSATATARGLTISTGGITTFPGAVGGTNPLAFLTTGTGTTNINGGGVTTRGAQTYNGPTVVGAATTNFNSTLGNTIRFDGTLNAAGAGMGVNVSTGGITMFNAVVGGGANAPAFLTTDGPGSTQMNGGVITTSGAQRYDDPVTLGTATTLNAGGNLTFSNTLNGPFALNANSSGVTTFAGIVGGGGNPLTSVMTDSAGSTSITGGAITTTGAQTFLDPVNASAVSFTSTGGGAITAMRGSNDFTGATAFNTTGAVTVTDLNAIQLGASVLGTGAFTVTSVGVSQTGPIAQGAGGGTATFNANAGPIALTQANTFTGPVVLNNSGANNVSLNNTGALQLGASAVGSGTLAVTATGAITQGGAITQQTGATGASFNAGGNAITLGSANDFTGPVSLTTTGGNNASVRDANTLILGASSVPGATFAVTAGGAVTQNPGTAITANTLTVNTTGNASATLNSATNAIANLGASDLGTGALNVLNAGALNVSGVITAGNVTLATTGALTDSPTARVVTANSPITLSGTTIGTAGSPFSVNAGTSTVSATSTTGSAFIDQSSGDVVTSRYTYNVPVGQTIGLAANVGGITADASVNAPGRNIVLTTQTAGNTIAIGSVTIDAASLTFDTTAASANLSIANSTVTFNTPVTTGANVASAISGTSNVTANGAMNFGGALSWSGPGILQGTGGVTAGTLNMVGNSPHLATTLTTTTYNQGPGGLTVDNNGVLNIANAGSSTINATQLVNNGRVNLSGTGVLQIRNTGGALINNGLVDMQSDAGFDSNTAVPGTLVNAAGATLRKSGGPGTSPIGQGGTVAFTNAGTLDAQVGTIQYGQNGNAFAGGTQFIGAGTHLITGNGTFNGTVTNAGNLTVNGGTQTINGTLTNNATLNFGAGGGNLAGTGTLSNAGALISAGTHQIGSGRFANSGTVNVNGGTLTLAGNDIDDIGALGDTGAYTVSGGATLAFRDGTRDFLAASSIGGAGGVQFASTIASTFNVRGPYNPVTTTIQDATTVVNFFGATTMPALTMTAGALNIMPGAVLAFTGAGGTSITGGTLTNSGTINVTGGNAQLNAAFPTNDGRLQIGTGATVTTTANLTNASTGFIGGTGTLNLAGAPPNNMLFNNGTLAPGASPGTLAITGNYAQGPLGTMAIEIAGPNQGVTYDLLTVSGTATLGGALNVTTLNGFVPAAGNRFTFMTFANRAGDFTSFTQVPANSGLQTDPGAVSYAVVGTLLPQDDTQNQLKRLLEELERARSGREVEEPRFRGGRQICE